MTIVNDDSRVVSEQGFKLIDYARGVIYNHRMFIIQATGWVGLPKASLQKRECFCNKHVLTSLLAGRGGESILVF